ncbi:MAG TPA: acetate/propionate family kinase [Gaiellaceae bacterium]|nr:acetate/propionate family kinase [Gaiellaceae bacterium]
MGRILVVNAGSTSLKLSLVEEDEAAEPVASLEEADPGGLDAIAHRVVHGGPDFREPVLVDDAVRDTVRRLAELAPLHNAPALRGIDEAAAALPGVPHVAVFDTAFHATIPAEAATYAVPPRWREEWGIRRYGFHGLSVQWAAEQVPVPRLVVCHLGGGCSVTAVRDGRSVDTTMGFTPLEGVPMATRPGSLDPGALLHLLHTGRLDADALDRALNHESGLIGLAGTADVGELEARAGAGDDDALLALAVFAYRVAGAVAAMATALAGLDALVFTAGIGERSATVREQVCARLAFLGVEFDAGANRAAVPDTDVAARGSAVRVLVVHAREDLVAARAARSLLAGR